MRVMSSSSSIHEGLPLLPVSLSKSVGEVRADILLFFFLVCVCMCNSSCVAENTAGYWCTCEVGW